MLLTRQNFVVKPVAEEKHLPTAVFN